MPNHSVDPTSFDSRLVVLAYDQLCTFEFGTAIEAFGRDDLLLGKPLYDLRIAAVEPGPLRAFGGFQINVEGGLELLEQAGTIVIPGWRDLAAEVDSDLLDALRAASQRGCRIVTICAGTFVLAATGLLAGKRATTHWFHHEELARAYPQVRVEASVLYVDEGDILTSAGCASGLDTCLHLIRRDFGPEAANRAARRMVTPPHRLGCQAQYIEQPVTVRPGSSLAPLLDRLRANPDSEIDIEYLARTAHMSRRTFLRRFHDATGTTPANWLLGVRLERAKDLLETSGLSIPLIAERCGFGTAATMRHHFRKYLESSPSCYRKQFGRVERMS
ncbi:transcriptional regulator FtrA [Pseudomonas putida]|uniref:Transcriptional regulator n=1 Tax=Pseudomonas putida TaxID=303 RepID=A0A177SF14_PSEPU|nr:transcriptional regulator FtrA [Pseudomonas putida]OAI86156.1 transcriptional regulator [Pseudomonas putida]